MITINSLLARALEIMNAVLRKENTALRVGSLLRDLLLFLQNLVLGIILKGTLANEAAIKALPNPNRGDTYKAADTNRYWCYDGTTWNDIGKVLPDNGATKDELEQLSSETKIIKDVTTTELIVGTYNIVTHNYDPAATAFKCITVPVSKKKLYITGISSFTVAGVMYNDFVGNSTTYVALTPAYVQESANLYSLDLSTVDSSVKMVAINITLSRVTGNVEVYYSDTIPSLSATVGELNTDVTTLQEDIQLIDKTIEGVENGIYQTDTNMLKSTDLINGYAQTNYTGFTTIPARGGTFTRILDRHQSETSNCDKLTAPDLTGREFFVL